MRVCLWDVRKSQIKRFSPKFKASLYGISSPTLLLCDIYRFWDYSWPTKALISIFIQTHFTLCNVLYCLPITIWRKSWLYVRVLPYCENVPYVRCFDTNWLVDNGRTEIQIGHHHVTFGSRILILLLARISFSTWRSRDKTPHTPQYLNRCSPSI